MQHAMELAIGRGAAGALDAAARLLREHLAALLPVYVLAVTPLALAMLWIIDAVTAQDRAAMFTGCLALTAATLWRWGWLAVLQRRVQARLAGVSPPPVTQQLPAILLHRLIACLLLTWGALFLVPPYWGFFLAGFAAPALLEPRTAEQSLSRTLGWITAGVGPLARAAAVLVGVFGALTLGAIATQWVVVGQVLPALTGITPTDAQLTMRGLGWLLASAFALFCVFDFFWHVAAVMLFYHLTGQRLGTDLQRRLTALEEGAVAG
jgi:hypothetical protein